MEGDEHLSIFSDSLPRLHPKISLCNIFAA